jgi:REP element-mobilizing transposase RayT
MQSPGNDRRANALLASHLVLHGYGHWLPNDPRGSGSTELRKSELDDLGEVHTGRKPRHEQPSRQDLRSFYRRAEPLLGFDLLWYRAREHRLIAEAFAMVLKRFGYTLWACALCANHAHLVVRAHRDRAEQIWNNFARQSAQVIRGAGIVPAQHPVWSHRPYKVFLFTWQDVVDRVGYVEDNPGKEGLAAQQWEFVSSLPKQCAGLVPQRHRMPDPPQ